MNNPIAIGMAIVAVAAVAVVLWWRSGPVASQFADLATPRFTRRDDQRMLVVEAIGDPNVVAGSAFALLFRAFYALEGVSRAQRAPAPRARWARPLETPRAQWVGRYALPVPPTVTAIPPVRTGPGFRLSLETWEYGEVAEVLHVGRYNDELADTDRLQSFIAASGRRIVGEHEEEYVRGPGMFFAGNPEKYRTIIRLRVGATLVEREIG